MISTEHNQPEDGKKKHAGLARPQMGNFGRNEWAIVGAPCAVIKQLADEIITALSKKYKCAYIDTSHNDEVTMLPGRLENGAAIEYTDEIAYRHLNYNTSFNSFKLKETFAGIDLILANGNHHQAKAQVVIISENKKSSLQKRIDQLTNVEMILLADGATEVFDFIKQALPNWQELPLYRLDETENIIDFFEQKMQQATPKINGLVLAGGKSQRMGFDKAAINWHGKAQCYHLADMLQSFCDEVFISCREGQEIDPNYSPLKDTFTGLGPYGAILSAFREKPDSAWLVIACDLPLLTENTLKHLTDNRDSSSIATAYNSSFDGLPEPLITIWEPKSYPVLLSFLSLGYSCPRKVLINSNTFLMDAPYPDELTNVNTPEDFEKVKSTLNSTIAAR